MDAKELYEGVGRLLTHSSRELPRPLNGADGKNISENGDHPVMENGDTSGAEEAEAADKGEKEQNQTRESEEA